MQIDNPSLKRIINVWGTVNFTDTLLKDERDFGPTIPSTMSNFKGSLPTSIENINIRITGAYHNDFTYDGNDHPDLSTPEKRERELVNRKTNDFMRKLYARAAEDQTTPGRLEGFLSNSQGVTYNPVTKIATVDPKLFVAAP